ncbi:MAG: hypothetical protein ACOCYD_02075 [bacterium]
MEEISLGYFFLYRPFHGVAFLRKFSVIRIVSFDDNSLFCHDAGLSLRKYDEYE